AQTHAVQRHGGRVNLSYDTRCRASAWRLPGADRTGATGIRCRFGLQQFCMTATEPTQNQPPEAELQFDIGSTDDSLERMVELFARHGDIYRVFVPARKAYTYVVHHPDDVKRVL